MANSKCVKTRATNWDYRQSPVFWFAQLEAAVTQGDFGAAKDASRELRRLGVEVRYPRREPITA